MASSNEFHKKLFHDLTNFMAPTRLDFIRTRGVGERVRITCPLIVCVLRPTADLGRGPLFLWSFLLFGDQQVFGHRLRDHPYITSPYFWPFGTPPSNLIFCALVNKVKSACLDNFPRKTWWSLNLGLIDVLNPLILSIWPPLSTHLFTDII